MKKRSEWGNKYSWDRYWGESVWTRRKWSCCRTFCGKGPFLVCRTLIFNWLTLNYRMQLSQGAFIIQSAPFRKIFRYHQTIWWFIMYLFLRILIFRLRLILRIGGRHNLLIRVYFPFVQLFLFQLYFFLNLLRLWHFSDELIKLYQTTLSNFPIIIFNSN